MLVGPQQTLESPPILLFTECPKKVHHNIGDTEKNKESMLSTMNKISIQHINLFLFYYMCSPPKKLK